MEQTTEIKTMLKKGDCVFVSMKAIYDSIADPERVDEEGCLRITEDGLGIRHGNNYYDLLGDDGNMVCCEGEMCQVTDVAPDGTLTLFNSVSFSCTKEFKLSPSEAETGVTPA